MKQQVEVLKAEKDTTDKIAARAFAQSYLQDLVPSVFGTLHDAGYFFDPVERDIETSFMPWLMEGVTGEIQKVVVARTLLDSIIRETVCNRTLTYAKLDIEVELRVRAMLEARNKKPTGTVEDTSVPVAAVAEEGTNSGVPAVVAEETTE